jgi:23S rRNA (uracil1939-C5)-methyltransferase
MVCLVANSEKLPHADALVKMLLETNPKIASIVLNVNKKPNNEILGLKCITLYGKDTIRDTLCGVSFDISPLSFYQINHDGAEVLYRTAAEFAELTEGDTLLDLYCGVGTIGLSMAHKAGKLIGVEVIPAAVENAKENARRNGVNNAEFICADAGEAAKKLAAENMKPDVVIVDPPRKGCGEDVIEAMKTLSPRRIVMVSCNSATAARDCARLAEIGYTATKMRAVDMFPRTGHVESVVCLTRK